jgi:hypothetical protein
MSRKKHCQQPDDTAEQSRAASQAEDKSEGAFLHWKKPLSEIRGLFTRWNAINCMATEWQVNGHSPDSERSAPK